jgi:hypothetical protein
MNGPVFRYSIRLADRANPPGTYDRLCEELRAFFVARGWEYGMGALGGSVTCYGEVGGPRRAATEGDRHELAEWVRQQRVCAAAQIGELESPPASLTDPITGLEFAVDNLTDQDRLAAALHHEALRKQLARRGSA